MNRLNILMYAIYLDPLRMDTILYIFILINGPLLSSSPLFLSIVVKIVTVIYIEQTHYMKTH